VEDGEFHILNEQFVLLVAILKTLQASKMEEIKFLSCQNASQSAPTFVLPPPPVTTAGFSRAGKMPAGLLVCTR
jgi:hypothetical protein